jgi:hypothetical protein
MTVLWSKLRKLAVRGEKTAVQKLENSLTFEGNNTLVHFRPKEKMASVPARCLTALLQCWRSTQRLSSQLLGSETKLSNGSLAGDDLGCKDANRSKHGKMAVAQHNKLRISLLLFTSSA